MSFSRPTQPKPYRQGSHTTLNQLAPHVSPLNGSCTALMQDRTLGLGSGTKKGNPMRQIRFERRIKVAIPPVGPICSVLNAVVCLIKECILETAVSIPNKEPLDLGDFSRGVLGSRRRWDSVAGCCSPRFSRRTRAALLRARGKPSR